MLLQSINAASVDETATRPLDSAIGTNKTAYTSILTGTMASTRLENTMPLTGTTLPDAPPCTVTSPIRGKPKASAAAGSKEQLPLLQVELSGITPPSARYTQSTSLTGTTLPDALPYTVTSPIRGKPKASAAAGSKEQLPLLQVELSGITPPSTRYTQSTSLTGTTLPDALPYTVTSPIRGKPKASAAAGSKEQLPRLQVELSGITPPSTRYTQSTSLHTSITLSRNKRLSKDSVIIEGEPQPPPAKTNLTSTVPQDSSEATATRICKRQSKVHLMPFQVQLTRLSDKELEKYLHSYDTKPASTPSSSLRLSPIATRSLTRSKQPQRKKRLISGHPSEINVPTYSFQIHRHLLCRHR